MPPNPWKLLKTKELTPEQRRYLRIALIRRQGNLKKAMDQLESAIKLLSASLDQDQLPKYAKKIKTKPKTKRT